MLWAEVDEDSSEVRSTSATDQHQNGVSWRPLEDSDKLLFLGRIVCSALRSGLRRRFGGLGRCSLRSGALGLLLGFEEVA